MLFCMENNENKFAVIKCIDGEVQLPFSQVQKFPFVMPETDATDFDLTKIRPSLNAETFKLLTTKKFEIPEEKSFEETYKMWKEADFLGLSDKKQAKIVQDLIYKAETVKQLVDIHRSQQFLDYCYHYDSYLKDLSICHKPNLKSISGIEELSFMNPERLCFYYNPSLTSINLDSIFKHFPRLNELYLEENNLTTIDATYLPSDFTLNIGNNRLSKEQIEKLKSLQTLPWYKKLYNFAPFKGNGDIDLTDVIAGAGYCILGVKIGMAIMDKELEIAYKYNLNDLTFGLILLPTVLIAPCLAFGMFCFDSHRFHYPYKAAKIIGENKQRQTSAVD